MMTKIPENSVHCKSKTLHHLKAGGKVKLYMDPNRVYLFDNNSGLNISE